MRGIKYIHRAINAPIADLKTYRALPTHSIEYIDPFLFLNHHGPQIYRPNNSGLPFGPHPHRGFETVTFILEGDILHKDSGGHESVIRRGGVQWMTAGKGLIHSETSSADFKRNGGHLEILQLWVNLPARLKMVEPHYVDLQSDDIPSVTEDEGKVTVQVVSGAWRDTKGAYQSATDIHLALVFFQAGGRVELDIPEERNIFFYLVRGSVTVNGRQADAFQLVEFNNDDPGVVIHADTDAVILFGHALPYKETVVSHGPFVMNSEQEIAEAYQDYRSGKLGTWR